MLNKIRLLSYIYFVSNVNPKIKLVIKLPIMFAKLIILNSLLKEKYNVYYWIIRHTKQQENPLCSFLNFYNEKLFTYI